MLAADIVARLPSDRQSEILDYLADFPATWGRRPVLKDLVEHFGKRGLSRADVVAELRGLHEKGYLIRTARGVEFRAPLIGEVR